MKPAPFKREILTIPNKLYGPRQVMGHTLDGVTVALIGKNWGVYHFTGGSQIYHKLARPSLKAAKDVARQIAALPIDWTAQPDDPEFIKTFPTLVGQIREIAS